MQLILKLIVLPGEVSKNAPLVKHGAVFQ